MKKVIMFFWVFSIFLPASYCEAITREECISLLDAGLYNFFLEDICHFNGGVKDRLKTLFDNNGCNSIVPPSVAKKEAGKVFRDTKRRLKAYGLDTFCESNMDSYNNLQPTTSD